MTELFSPLALRSVTLPNRIAIPPMCQYAAKDGMANDFHFANYARFAMGGAGLIIVEATAIDPAGRISHGDLGLWHDAQIRPLQRLTRFLTSLGAIPAIQINHGGRKAGQRRPWHGNSPLDQSDAARGEAPWPVIGPSALAMADNWPMPRALDKSDIQGLVDAWGAAARRADEAGFESVEIHAAHGYLLNQFLSPLSNRRNDAYGGDRAGRMRFVLEVTEAVRSCWPRQKPLLVRVSAVDGVDGGWDIDDTVVLAHELKARGVDAIHCSSGGLFGAATAARLPRVPGFQVPFAERVRHEARVPTIAVGLILTPQQAADVIDTGKADIVAIGREALADPNWALHARLALLPERGFADWPVESGWWLERRQAAMATTG